jgi:two-component system, OmpR family, response regulator
MQIRVLLVEDHDKTRLAVSALLRQAGYTVRAAANGSDALALLAQHAFDVVLTDIWMDGIDGIAVLRAARAAPNAPAVILLTGSSSVETSVAALRAGAFDYLEKPFDPAALVQRVAHAAQQRSIEQRQQEALTMLARLADMVRVAPNAAPIEPPPPTLPGTAIVIGALHIGADRRAVTYNDIPIELTPIEYTLLQRLASAQGKPVSASALVQASHSYSLPASEAQKLIKVHIRNLRHKLPPGYLHTLRGKGYALAAPTDLTPV